MNLPASEIVDRAVAPNDEGPAAKPSRLSVLLWALIVAAALLARIRLIDGSMPYPGHLDEQELAEPAANILRTSDWNPHQFEYPSLPIYLITGSFAVGYLDACATRAVKRVADIGSVSFPYYTHARVVRPARILFALLSVVSLGLSGVIGQRLTGDSRPLWLAPLVLASSATFLQLSWQYLNVDIVGCACVTALLAFLASQWRATGLLRRCVIPGVLCGLALASKYNLFPAFLASVLAIVLAPGGGRLGRVALLLATAGVTFVAAVPYAILDVRAFLDGAGGAIHHYALGHPGFRADPGWPQLAYYARALLGDFGWISPPVVVAGAVVALRADWRKATVLLSFAAGQLLYMSLQRAHFPRNVLSVYPLYAAFEAVGWVAVADLAWSSLSGTTIFSGRERAKSAAVACLMLLMAALGTPWRRALADHLRAPDSRRLAAAWIRRSVPTGSTLIVARELAMDTRPLRALYRVVERPVRSVDPAAVEGGADAYWLIPRIGFHTPWRRRREGDANRMLDEKLVPLARFGHSLAWLDYPEHVPWGDPVVTIGRLQSTQLP